MTGYSLDTNDMAKSMVVIALGEIPVAGGILSGLVGMFWPDSQPDIWGEVKGRVEALVDQEISKEVYEDVSTTLKGLRGVLNVYQQALVLSKGRPGQLNTAFFHTRAEFEQAAPHFQLSDHRLLLLPLFARFVDMHLALLRDGITQGADFDLDHRQVAAEKVTLKQKINEYSRWSLETYQIGAGKYPLAAYHRQMTVDVMDRRNYWPYFDPDINPGGKRGIVPPLVRELFLDLGAGGISSPVDTRYLTYSWNQGIKPRLTSIRVFESGNGLVSGFALQLAGDWQPVEIRGDFGSLAFEAEVASNPIIRLTGSTTGRIINTLTLHYEDGTSSPQVGRVTGGVPFDVSMPGHVMRAMYYAKDTYSPTDILWLGFCAPEGLYDDRAAIVDIKFKSWQDVDTSLSSPTLLDAARAAGDLNARLVSPSEVASAWKHNKLNVLQYCTLECGFLALPLQQDSPDGKFKRGSNVGITGGNQGFLYRPLK